MLTIDSTQRRTSDNGRAVPDGVLQGGLLDSREGPAPTFNTSLTVLLPGAREMVDRVYKKGIPEYRKALEALREEFARLGGKTDWVRLRVDPILQHARQLDRLLASRRFAPEFARLTKGVALFHSDLVYLSTNVKELRGLLRTEARRRPS